MSNDSTWANTSVESRAGSVIEYVGFWARVVASLIDTVLLVLVTWPLTYLVYGRKGFAKVFMHGPVDVLINFILPAVLIIWLWSKLQATPGKMAMSAKIVDADTGAEPTLQQLLIRYVGYFVSAIPLCLGFFWVGFDRRKQGWHDKMANTVVIRPAGKQVVRFKGRFG